MSIRSATPVYEWSGSTEDPTYTKIKKLKLPALAHQVHKDTYEVFFDSAEESAKIYKVLRQWPTNHYFKRKLLEELRRTNQLP